MNERPTPETDAQARAIYANVSPTNNQRFAAMTKWAEKLESERDEARTQADNFAKNLEEMRDAIREAKNAFQMVIKDGRSSWETVQSVNNAMIKLSDF